MLLFICCFRNNRICQESQRHSFPTRYVAAEMHRTCGMVHSGLLDGGSRTETRIQMHSPAAEADATRAVSIIDAGTILIRLPRDVSHSTLNKNQTSDRYRIGYI